MKAVIKEIQKDFFREAQHSPILLSDLANMEKYIAESYQERSIIELLQNADDAGAKKFYINKIGDVVIVANDGRTFNATDAIAICRSGSSSKRRDGSTIGYRGIGFKSVVNFANRVHVLSNELEMTFSKELTSNLMNSNIEVPLVRIPHDFIPFDQGIVLVKEKLFSCGYKTIFIFENVHSHVLDIELFNFDPSSLIFLNNIDEVIFDTDQYVSITSNREHQDNKQSVQIKMNDIIENWLVVHDADNKSNAVAFLTNDQGQLLPLDQDRAVVHAFMPTKEYVGLPIKINGDFSTDPSRTKVVFDETSRLATETSARILLELTKELLSTNLESFNAKGIFELLSSFKDEISFNMKSNKFKDRFLEEFKKVFKDKPWFYYNGQIYTVEKLRINSDWLNYNDFQGLCDRSDNIPISKALEGQFPCLLRFSKALNIAEFTLEEILNQLISYVPSVIGGVEILAKCIEQYRFNLDVNKLNLIKKANLIMFPSGFIPLEKVNSQTKIDIEFMKLLEVKLADSNDINWFFKKLNVRINSIRNRGNQQINNKIDLTSNNRDGKIQDDRGTLFIMAQQKGNSITSNGDPDFTLNGEMKHYRASVSKWRSVEKNLAACLENDEGVLKVVDVSKSNLGYDLEVHTRSGTLCVEVKSVKRIGEPFSITNNEYSTASQLSDQFVIAIAKQTEEELEVCYITNPITTIELTKRVTQWEWIADEYSGRITTYKF